MTVSPTASRAAAERGQMQPRRSGDEAGENEEPRAERDASRDGGHSAALLVQLQQVQLAACRQRDQREAERLHHLLPRLAVDETVVLLTLSLHHY